jgi:carbonic anhydrase
MRRNYARFNWGHSVNTSQKAKHHGPRSFPVRTVVYRRGYCLGGLGVGELFVARNAGNKVDTSTMGTIEYGSAVLGVPMIIVLGHKRCGAVSAACEVVEKRTKFPASIGPMVDAIVPAALTVVGKPGDFVDNTVRESAIRTAHKIATESSIIADLVKKGKVKVIAACYDLDDGRVEFFS